MVGVSSFVILADSMWLSCTETVTGDWFRTEQSWRRLAHGRIQQAGLVEGGPDAVVCFLLSQKTPAECVPSQTSALGMMPACPNVLQ